MSTQPAERNLVFEVIKDVRLVVSCQNVGFLTDTEWANWLLAVMNLEREVSSVRLLVVSEGGHPTKAQIDRVRAVNRTNPPMSIVSPSRGYRFMAAALTFLNPAIRCYSPHERDKAYDHLGIAANDRDRIELTIDRLNRKLTASQTRTVRNEV
jgi:hypothetical protein